MESLKIVIQYLCKWLSEILKLKESFILNLNDSEKIKLMINSEYPLFIAIGILATIVTIVLTCKKFKR